MFEFHCRCGRFWTLQEYGHYIYCPSCNRRRSPSVSSIDEPPSSASEESSEEILDSSEDREEKVLDTNWFVGDTDNYTCPICLGVLRNAMQAIVGAQCGHRYCEVCVKDVFKGEGAPCPVCRVKVEKSNLHPDVGFRRQISELRVRCHVNPDRCNVIGQFGKGEWWEQHEKVCIANTDPCVMCSQRVLKSAMRAHLAECKELEINCPFACMHTCKRKDMQGHEEKCKLTRGPRSVVRCRFAALGCRFKAKRCEVKKVEAHMKAEAAKHLGMLLGEAEEREEIYLMEYVLLSKKIHKSNKFTAIDGTRVWFDIFPFKYFEKEKWYSFFLNVDQPRYIQYNVKAWVVKPDTSLQLKEDHSSSQSWKPMMGFGRRRFLPAEPGTLMKLEVSGIKLWSHIQRNSSGPAPSLLKQLKDSQQQLKDVQQHQQQQQQQQKQELEQQKQQQKKQQQELEQQKQQQKKQQQEMKNLQQQLRDLQRQLTQQSNLGKRGKAKKTETEEEPPPKRTRSQRL
eukprot:g35119.t1